MLITQRDRADMAAFLDTCGVQPGTPTFLDALITLFRNLEKDHTK